MALCQLSSQSNREGGSQPATVIVLCGYVEASFDFSTDFFSQTSPSARVCHCGSVSATLTEPEGGCMSDSNWHCSLWLCGGFDLDFSFDFLFKFLLLSDCGAVSVCQSH